ncbi:MAG: hypothetical protein ACR2JX_06370, partial [Mycobacteriales bacterium]
SAEGPDFFFVTSFSVMGSHGTFPAEPPGPANQTQNTLKYTDPTSQPKWGQSLAVVPLGQSFL